MKVLSKLIELVQDMFLPKWFLVTTMIWVILFLICWIVGGVALWQYGRRQGYRKNIIPWVPGLQIYSTAIFTGLPRTAKRIQHCLWWWLVAAAGCLTCGIWLAAGMVGVTGVPTAALKIILIVLATILVLLYLLIRADEMVCIKKALKKPYTLAVAAFGIVFCLPVHRILFFFAKEK